jgi:hypothetical protein
MAQLSDIKWGKYLNFEGPYYKGSCKLNLNCKTFDEKVFQVTSKAEGCLDAINMYDSALMTCGALQFIDRVPQFSICEMLGILANTDGGYDLIIKTLGPALQQSGATFKKNLADKWRFFLPGNIEVCSATQQQRLYFNGPNTYGSFDESRKQYAKTWAVCMVNLWQNEKAQKVQIDYTLKNLLKSYIVGNGKQLFDNEHDNTGWVGAVRAAYVSFSVNSPALASRCVGKAIASSGNAKFTPEWCLDIIHDLTFSGVKIWPQRYDNIRAELEKQFGVSLPQTAVALSKHNWSAIKKSVAPEPIPGVDIPLPDLPLIVEEVVPIQNNIVIPSNEDKHDHSQNINLLYAVVGFINIIAMNLMRACGK